LNKATKTKVGKKQINEDVKSIRELVKPFSSDLKKSKKNIELLQIIFRLESKSEELKLILKIIYDKNFQISELTYAQVVMLNKKIYKTNKEISEIFYSKNKQIPYDNKNFRAYAELITGTKPKTLDKIVELEKRENAVSIERKKLFKKYRSGKKMNQIPRKKMKNLLDYVFKEKLNKKEISQLYYFRDLIITAIGKKIEEPKQVKKRTSKQIAKDKKMNLEIKEKINTISALNHTSLLLELKKQEKIKDKIKKISDLKDSCETCYQKISKPYQKNSLKKLERQKNMITKMVENTEEMNVIVSRMKFIVDDGKYLPFKEAKKYVNMLMIKSEKEWNQHAVINNKLPANIPRYPHIEYSSNENKEEWTSWSDWLGVKPQKYRSFKEAREFVRKLNIKTSRDWIKAINSGMIPADIPTIPAKEYRKDWIKGKRLF